MSIRDREAEYDYRHRHGYRRPYRIFPALIVIGIGALFLLGNLGYDLDFFHRNNWWAWLILLAAAAPLLEAVQRFREVEGSTAGYCISCCPQPPSSWWR